MKTDWSKAKWEKSDSLIAISLGVSRSNVNAMRKKLGKPQVKASRPNPFNSRRKIGNTQSKGTR